MREKKKVTISSILVIQGAVIIYTLSGIFAKFSSRYEVMSPMFLLFVFLELAALGLYAIVWQQIIKRFDLSLAYANRATAIFWSMLWAVILFKEGVTLKNILGVVIIFAGIMVVNSDAA